MARGRQASLKSGDMQLEGAVGDVITNRLTGLRTQSGRHPPEIPEEADHSFVTNAEVLASLQGVKKKR
jgi:hypothetical protein